MLSREVEIQDVHYQFSTFVENWLIVVRIGGVEKVDYSFAAPNGQGMSSQCQVLRLLQRVALQERESSIPYAGDVTIIWIS